MSTEPDLSFLNGQIQLAPSQTSIEFEKNFNVKQPDFNDFDAIFNCVSSLDSIRQLEFSDFSYKITSKEPFEVTKGIMFKLEEILKIDKTDKIDKIRFKIYSDTLEIKDLKEYVRKCRTEYEAQKNNKLGGECFYFDQIVSVDSKFGNSLSFDKKRFVTARTFKNIFFEEKKDVEARVNHFINNKKWYDERGIPYTLGFMFQGPPGTGKCLAPGTSILMYNGSTKKVEDIVKGDLLVNPDTMSAVEVINLAEGRDTMFKVDILGGTTSFTCNSAHILSLKLKRTFTTFRKNNVWFSEYYDRTTNASFEQILNADYYYKDITKYVLNADTQLELYDLQKIVCAFKTNLVIKDNTINIPIQEYLNESVHFKYSWMAYMPHTPTQAPNENTDLNAKEYPYELGRSVFSLSRFYQDIKLKNLDDSRGFLAGVFDAESYMKQGKSGKNYIILDLQQCNHGKNSYYAQVMQFILRESRRCGIYAVEYQSLKWSFSGEHLKYVLQFGSKYDLSHFSETNYGMHLYNMKITNVGMGKYYGFTLTTPTWSTEEHGSKFLLGNYIATHNTSTIKAIANVTGRHVIKL